jgi:hypothetical protein
MSNTKQKNLWNHRNLIIKYQLPLDLGLGFLDFDDTEDKTSRITSKTMILAFMKINIIRKIFHFYL